MRLTKETIMTEKELIDVLMFIRYYCNSIEEAEQACDEALAKLGVIPL